MNDKPFTIQFFLKKLVAPQWFILLITLLYVSGFLCEFTFFDRYGIRESGESFLKARYIYAGILFLLFPISIMIPVFLYFSLKKTEFKEKVILNEKSDLKQQTEKDPSGKSTKQNDSFHLPYYTIASFFNIGLMFYFMIFTPRNFVLGIGEWVFALIILISFVGALIINWISKKWFLDVSSG